MFDIGWSEMAVIVLIALLVIGPKDLPKVMRSASHWVRKARGMAREFQSGVDDMIREADLDDARKAVESARALDVRKALDETIDPTGDVREEARQIEASARDTDTSADGEKNSEKSAEKNAKQGDGAETDTAREPVAPNIAPPHSLTPPAASDDGTGGESVTQAQNGGDAGKRASQT